VKCRHRKVVPFRFNPEVYRIERDDEGNVVAMSGGDALGKWLHRSPVQPDESDGNVCLRCNALFIAGWQW